MWCGHIVLAWRILTWTRFSDLTALNYNILLESLTAQAMSIFFKDSWITLWSKINVCNWIEKIDLHDLIIGETIFTKLASDFYLSKHILRRQGMLTLNIKHVKSFLSQSCQNSVQREMAKFEIKRKWMVWRFCDIRRSRVDDKKSTLLIRVAQTLKIRHKEIDQKRKKKFLASDVSVFLI